jgi:hypothetical protein
MLDVDQRVDGLVFLTGPVARDRDPGGRGRERRLDAASAIDERAPMGETVRLKPRDPPRLAAVAVELMRFVVATAIVAHEGALVCGWAVRWSVPSFSRAGHREDAGNRPPEAVAPAAGVVLAPRGERAGVQVRLGAALPVASNKLIRKSARRGSGNKPL